MNKEDKEDKFTHTLVLINLNLIVGSLLQAMIAIAKKYKEVKTNFEAIDHIDNQRTQLNFQ